MHAVKTTSTQAARFRDPFIASVSRRAAPTDGEAVLRVDSRVVGRQALSYLLEVAIRRVSVLSLADWMRLMMLAARCPARRIREKPVLAKGCRPDSALHVIIIDRQIAIIEVTGESRPAPKAVVDRLSRVGAIRDLATLSSEPSLVLISMTPAVRRPYSAGSAPVSRLIDWAKRGLSICQKPVMRSGSWTPFIRY